MDSKEAARKYQGHLAARLRKATDPNVRRSLEQEVVYIRGIEQKLYKQLPLSIAERQALILAFLVANHADDFLVTQAKVNLGR